MQTTTLESLLERDWTPSDDAACLLRLRDAETIFYVEQARHPWTRLQEHLGRRVPPPSPSRLGRWLLLHRAYWGDLQVDMLGLADITPSMMQELPTSLRWWDALEGPLHQEAWEAVHRAEYALIRYHRPCLNEQYNRGPGRTCLPPGYQPF